MTTADRESDLFSGNTMVLLYLETPDFLQGLPTLAMVVSNLLFCLENPPLGWNAFIYSLFILKLLSMIVTCSIPIMDRLVYICKLVNCKLAISALGYSAFNEHFAQYLHILYEPIYLFRYTLIIYRSIFLHFQFLQTCSASKSIL